MARVATDGVKKVAATKASTANLQMRGITPRRVDDGPLEWYEITEQTMFVLNNRLASTLKLRLAEQRSEHPNPQIIEDLTADIQEITRIKSDPDNFSSLKTMKNILQKYV